MVLLMVVIMVMALLVLSARYWRHSVWDLRAGIKFLSATLLNVPPPTLGNSKMALSMTEVQFVI